MDISIQEKVSPFSWRKLPVISWNILSSIGEGLEKQTINGDTLYSG